MIGLGDNPASSLCMEYCQMERLGVVPRERFVSLGMLFGARGAMMLTRRLGLVPSPLHSRHRNPVVDKPQPTETRVHFRSSKLAWLAPHRVHRKAARQLQRRDVTEAVALIKLAVLLASGL
jgi:hypothetical protein